MNRILLTSFLIGNNVYANHTSRQLTDPKVTTNLAATGGGDGLSQMMLMGGGGAGGSGGGGIMMGSGGSRSGLGSSAKGKGSGFGAGETRGYPTLLRGHEATTLQGRS